jgi:hypothetical protein
LDKYVRSHQSVNCANSKRCSQCNVLTNKSPRNTLQKMLHIATYTLRVYCTYCHIWGVCMTYNNGFWIGWLDLLALLYNYSQLWQLTISVCLRLAPFLTGPRVSSLPLWRMTNKNSFPNEFLVFLSTAPALNNDSLTNAPLIYEWNHFYNLGRTDERVLPPTVRVLNCIIHCYGNVLTEPFLSSGLFQLVPKTCVSGPLASSGLFRLSGVMPLHIYQHTFCVCILYAPTCAYAYVLYTGCPRRNLPYFGKVFLMLKYTDITQNTYVQSWTVTEIMARE